MGLNQWKELPRVVSIVGAGGKTTVMYALARRLAGEGRRVLVMTTTHIYEPAACYAPTAAAAGKLWESGSFAVIGQKSSRPGKLTKPDTALLEALSREADHILVEADGAKHYPIKAPRDQEPVILPGTGLVIAVMGLSAIGKPLNKCCFGLCEAMALLQKDENQLLTAEDAALLLTSELGGRKNVGVCPFCVILNQCDDESAQKSAEQITFRLKELGVQAVYITSFDPSQRNF